MNTSWSSLIFFGLIFGGITAYIAQRKNLGNVGGWFFFGALLFIVALPMVIFAKPGLPQAPPGMLAVKCPRCNAVQNVPYGQATFECWRCKLVSDTASAGLLDVPEDTRTWLNRMQKQPDAPQNLAPRQHTMVTCPNCQRVQAMPLGQPTFVCEQCNTTQ
jgi:hypothetical protein